MQPAEPPFVFVFATRAKLRHVPDFATEAPSDVWRTLRSRQSVAALHFCHLLHRQSSHAPHGGSRQFGAEKSRTGRPMEIWQRKTHAVE